MYEKKFLMFYKRKNVLIPGGAGFIGSNLVKKLVKCGANVTIVDAFSKYCGANSFNIDEIKKNVLIVDSKIEDFISENGLFKYDIIFNCVGLTNHYFGFNNVKLDYNLNCYAGLKILEGLKNNNINCRVISIGSRSQYGRTRSLVIKETHPLNPIDIHSIHKTTLEYYHNVYSRNYGLDLIFLRLTNVYGPCQRLKGDGIGIIGEIIKSAINKNNIFIYGSLERIKDFLFIDDVVNAILLLGMIKKTDLIVYNLGGGLCKLSDLINAVKTKIKKVNIKILPFPKEIKKIDTGDVVLDIERIKKIANWTPKTNIETGIGITFKYYKEYKKYYL